MASGIDVGWVRSLRYAADTEAKKEFFFLTALAVKMTSDLREDVCIISSQELFDKACEEDVHFCTLLLLH